MEHTLDLLTSFTSLAILSGMLQSPGYRGRWAAIPDSNTSPFLHTDKLKHRK